MSVEREGVHEAWGPVLPPSQVAAALSMGVLALLAGGVAPVLLGALADEQRLSNSQIGLASMAEVLAMGVATALMGLAGVPRRLRTLGVVGCVALAVGNLLCRTAGGTTFVALRAAAGAVEGVLLWISVGMIARTATPERWAGAFFTAQTALQALTAVAFASVVLPRWNAEGGYGAIALIVGAGAVLAFWLPSSYVPMPSPHGAGAGGPSLRGWAALAATVPFVAGGGAIAVYLQPLAHQDGLTASVARTALWTALGAQVAGGAAATALAGRVGYMTVFLAGGAASLVGWMLLGLHIPAWLFVADNMALGLAAMLIAPFITPMTIAADATRRAALQTGAAQLLGGALGPFLASLAVSGLEVRGVLWLGAGLLLVGLAGVAALRFTDPAV
ncbi:MAG TPA: hypothetical protein VG248_12225 [Caulobacteraceae bacterium]|nr:hypothetical protein [Caulobacteraceae bacterium]